MSDRWREVQEKPSAWLEKGTGHSKQRGSVGTSCSPLSSVCLSSSHQAVPGQLWQRPYWELQKPNPGGKRESVLRRAVAPRERANSGCVCFLSVFTHPVAPNKGVFAAGGTKAGFIEPLLAGRMTEKGTLGSQGGRGSVGACHSRSLWSSVHPWSVCGSAPKSWPETENCAPWLATGTEWERNSSERTTR